MLGLDGMQEFGVVESVSPFIRSRAFLSQMTLTASLLRNEMQVVLRSMCWEEEEMV